MQALFLVFLAAAWLSEMILAIGLSPHAMSRRASLSLGLATGVAVLVPALLDSTHWLGTASESNSGATRLPHFLFAVSFMCVLMQLASGRARPAHLSAGARHWRIALPLLSGNLAVFANYLISVPRRPVDTLAASIGLTITLALLVPIAMAVLDRLQVSRVPAPMRGTPIIILTAALAAVGLTELFPVLPW